MTNVAGVVSALFKTALRKTYPLFTSNKSIIQRNDALRFGDYKCTAAMSVAQVRDTPVINAIIIMILDVEAIRREYVSTRYCTDYSKTTSFLSTNSR